MSEITVYRVYHTGTDHHYEGLSLDPESGAEESRIPLRVAVPDGWHVEMTGGGEHGLFSPACRMAAHLTLYRDHVQAVTSAGFTRLPITWRADYDRVSGYALDPDTHQRIES